MMRLGYLAAGLAAAMMGAGPASAAMVGFFSDNVSAYDSAKDATLLAGQQFTGLDNLGAGSLAAIDVLWLANSSNDVQLAELLGNLAGIASFVAGGGVLVYHDREVERAETVLPGIGGTDIVRDFNDDANIEVIAAHTSLTNGAGGIIDGLTLDGGNSSSHGMSLSTTLPNGAVAILSRGAANEVVDFTYGHGEGFVHYSTIPLDYYLAGQGTHAGFQSIYAPNVVGYAADLLGQTPVPLPASLPLALGALAGLSLRLRRRQTGSADA